MYYTEMREIAREFFKQDKSFADFIKSYKLDKATVEEIKELILSRGV